MHWSFRDILEKISNVLVFLIVYEYCPSPTPYNASIQSLNSDDLEIISQKNIKYAANNVHHNSQQ